MKSKRVDLEINQTNDGENNINVNLIILAAVKIENNNEQM